MSSFALAAHLWPRLPRFNHLQRCPHLLDHLCPAHRSSIASSCIPHAFLPRYVARCYAFLAETNASHHTFFPVHQLAARSAASETSPCLHKRLIALSFPVQYSSVNVSFLCCPRLSCPSLDSGCSHRPGVWPSLLLALDKLCCFPNTGLRQTSTAACAWNWSGSSCLTHRHSRRQAGNQHPR
jgi:hypothetical protein